jgi:hypothetical protein
MVKIWDVVKEEYWVGEEGELLTFENETSARNMMYTEGYKLEYVETGVEFHLHTPIDKSGYDLD